MAATVGPITCQAIDVRKIPNLEAIPIWPKSKEYDPCNETEEGPVGNARRSDFVYIRGKQAGESEMKNETGDAFWRSARVTTASVLASMILAGGSTALADGNGKSISISGNSTFSNCGVAGSDFALGMTGDLAGCLSIFVQGFTCKELADFDHYTERGREAFVGTLRGKQGRFTTDYTVDAAYAKGFCQSLDFSLELSGSCIHEIHGRSGVFTDGEGVFTLFDVITNVTGDPVTGAFKAGGGANNFLYSGSIHFDRDD
jgi:hypothetical protein